MGETEARSEHLDSLAGTGMEGGHVGSASQVDTP